MMRRQRNAKIIATLGPASSTEQLIRALFEAGVDVFRLNFSHGSQSDHAERLATIRKLEKEFDRPIAVLQDLQGPKLRLGTFATGRAQLETGASFRLDMGETSARRRIDARPSTSARAERTWLRRITAAITRPR